MWLAISDVPLWRLLWGVYRRNLFIPLELGYDTSAILLATKVKLLTGLMSPPLTVGSLSTLQYHASVAAVAMGKRLNDQPMPFEEVSDVTE